MRNSIAILILISFWILSPEKSFSQAFANKKIEISNPVLVGKIQDYEKYLKEWAPKAHVDKYIITVVSERSSFSNIITLHVVESGPGIDIFNPSAYSVIKNTPVIINTGFESYYTKDADFIAFLQNTYWKEGTEKAKLHKAEVLKKYQESLQNLPDSVKVYSKAKKKAVMIARKDMTPAIIDPELEQNLEIPKSWVLTFNRGKFISESIDQADHHHQ